MSILIKGMEMPTRCEDCPCFYPEYNECNAIVGRWVDGKATPPSDCPLVHVPTHGRLIDADAIRKNYKHELSRTYLDDYAKGFQSGLNAATGEHIHTVDAVPVVRCKECKHKKRDGYCTVHQRNVYGIAASWWKPADDYFCADGERKGGEE